MTAIAIIIPDLLIPDYKTRPVTLQHPHLGKELHQNELSFSQVKGLS